jgi:hypothetical protein
MKDNKLTLYDVKWQALRVGLLGNWTSYEGAVKNLERLTNYIEEQNTSISSLWRVLNLLNAVRMGYSGQKLKGSAQDKLVQLFRNKIQPTYRLLQASGAKFDIPTRRQITEDWRALTEEQRTAIYANLSKRRDLHSHSEHRDELRWFLDLVWELRV